MSDVRDDLNKLAVEILNEDGQVAVAAWLDDGKIGEARSYLFRAADQLMQAGELVSDELVEVQRRIGLSKREIAQIRAGGKLL